MATANGSKLLARTVLGVAAVATLAVTGCSAGQVTQTDTQVAPVTGNSAIQGDISLQDLMIQFNGVEGYAQGEDAPLVVRIFNLGTEFPDRLLCVQASASDSVTLNTGETAETPDAESPEPGAESPDPNAESPEPGTESPDPNAESPEPGAESPSPVDTPPVATDECALTDTAGTAADVTVAAADFALLVPGEGLFLQMNDIKEDLGPGSIVTVTFTFERAGAVPVSVPMGLPLSPEDRSHAEDEGGH